MHVQISTDGNIEGDNALTRQVEAVVRDTLHRFSERVVRVDVHLSDQDSDTKSGTRDKRCLLEVRLVGRKPTAVSHQARTLEQAVDGAAQKMKHSLVSTLGRLGNR